MALPSRPKRRPARRVVVEDDIRAERGDAQVAAFARANHPSAASGRFRPSGPVDPYENDPRIDRDDVVAAVLARHKFPRRRIVSASAAVLSAFAAGWLMAFYGFPPGVFRAADVGMPVLFLATLSFLNALAVARVPNKPYAEALGLLPRASGWAIIGFSSVLTLTNVPQLAYGIAFGVLGFAVYSTRLQLRAFDEEGLGRLAGPTMGVIVAYVVWALARAVVGPAAVFSLASFVAGSVFAVVVVRAADRRLVEVARSAHEKVQVMSRSERQRASEKRTIVAVVIAYLVFRFFVSSFIPYGPIVEWVLICVGILFFSVILAQRIGTVPTSQTLPDHAIRRHVQQVASLPDQRLADTADALEAFIEHGLRKDDVVATLGSLYDDLDVPEGPRRRPLDALRAHRQGQRRRTGATSLGGPALRRTLVVEALDGLRDERPGTRSVGRGGTQAPSAHPEPRFEPVTSSAPSPRSS